MLPKHVVSRKFCAVRFVEKLWTPNRPGARMAARASETISDLSRPFERQKYSVTWLYRSSKRPEISSSQRGFVTERLSS